MANNNPSNGHVGGVVSGTKGPAGVLNAGCGDVKVPAGVATPAPKNATIVNTSNAGQLGGSPADVSPASNKK